MDRNSSKSWFMQLLDQQKDHHLKEKINSYHKTVVQSCRDEFVLHDAKNIVPIAELVQENLNILDGDYQDNLLPILAQWFANEFFSWFSPPACEKCGGHLTAHERYINLEGNSVETYKCLNSESCHFTFDFIRHNDPAILLHTRKGRCGEWANCFFLILRAMDYDARIVLDTTDHVWNEVWSEARQQWVHVDPCEAVVDCPLLYELGWSKKLEYCIAFSKYEVIDVTRRYTKYINATKRNRSANTQQSSSQQQEIWLANYLDELTMQMVGDVDDSTRDTVLRRRAIDMKHLEEFETEGRPEVDISKLAGRKTGSIAWRISRGEYSPIIRTMHVIKVQPHEQRSSNDCGIFSIEYDCDKNLYISTNDDLNVKGWQKLIYHAENVDHKFERDWKTSYLARYESCSPDVEGKIQWRFDLAALGRWARMEITIIGKTWPDTLLKAEFVGIDSSGGVSVRRELKLNEINAFAPDDLEAAKKMTSLDLIISYVGGQPDDSVAWQKPQLFRQVRGQSSGAPFSFRVF